MSHVEELIHILRTLSVYLLHEHAASRISIEVMGELMSMQVALLVKSL